MPISDCPQPLAPNSAPLGFKFGRNAICNAPGGVFTFRRGDLGQRPQIYLTRRLGGQQGASVARTMACLLRLDRADPATARCSDAIICGLPLLAALLQNLPLGAGFR
jgi:hypothetical protein